MKSGEKIIEYTRKSLRSAKDIFNKGDHVTTILKDQTFRLLHDNRRSIVEDETFKNINRVDLSNTLMDSKPLKNINHWKTLRFGSKFPITNPFNKNNANRSQTTYKTNIEVGVRNFIKGYYSKNETFGLKGNEFKYVKDIISFIYGRGSTKDIKISTSSVSKLKNRKLIWKPVPPTVKIK